MARLLLFITIILSIIVFSCARSNNQDNTKLIQKEHKATIYLKKLLHIETYDTHTIIDHSFASGICVKSDAYHNYRTILSVEHFCKDKSVELKKLIGELSKVYNISEADVIDVSYDIDGMKFDGTSYKLSVVKLDDKSDLCILTFVDNDELCEESIRIAKSFPQQGEKLYNIASPMSIFMPNVALIFDGYYAGLDTNDNMMLTIPATFGSSGSPVFDKRGQLVSIITKTVTKFNNIAIGVNLDEIREFINNDKDK